MNLILPFAKPLDLGIFKSRYKRFFVDVLRPDGSLDTIHCANSGSMKSCLEANSPVYSLKSDNPSRKLASSLELMGFTDGLACLNTARANQFYEQFLILALQNKLLFDDDPERFQAALTEKDFQGVTKFRREAVFSAHTRFDFLLERESTQPQIWVEIKSVSLRLDAATIAFPDAKTERGQKHLRELMRAKSDGHEAFMVFVVMRGSELNPRHLAQSFRTAHEIDPVYARLLEQALAAGVKIRLLIPSITPHGMGLRGYFPFLA